MLLVFVVVSLISVVEKTGATELNAAVGTLMREALDELPLDEAAIITKKDLTEEWAAEELTCSATDACAKKYNEHSTEMMKTAEGLTAALSINQGFKDILKKDGTGNFKTVVDKLVKLTPFLSAIGPALQLWALMGNSAEANLIEKLTDIVQKGFQRMEYRFTKLEYQIADLQQYTGEQFFKQSLQEPVRKMEGAKERVVNIINADKQVDKDAKIKRLKDSDFYWDENNMAITTVAGIFLGTAGTKLCYLVRRYTKEDRRMFLHIATELFNRLVLAVQNKLFIAEIKELGDKDSLTTTECDRLKEIGRDIDQCDMDIKNDKWKNQWRQDATEIANTEGQTTDNEKVMADALQKFLADKYYWRTWMIVVFGKADGTEEYLGPKQQIRTCGESEEDKITLYLKNVNDKYNVIITSKETGGETAPVVTNGVTLDNVKTNDNTARPRNYKPFNAEKIIEHFPASVKDCTKFPIYGVVRRGTRARKMPGRGPKDLTLEIAAPNDRKLYIIKDDGYLPSSHGSFKYHLFALG